MISEADKTFVRSKVWFPKIDKDIETEVKSCLTCLRVLEHSNTEPLIQS